MEKQSDCQSHSRAHEPNVLTVAANPTANALLRLHTSTLSDFCHCYNAALTTEYSPGSLKLQLYTASCPELPQQPRPRLAEFRSARRSRAKLLLLAVRKSKRVADKTYIYISNNPYRLAVDKMHHKLQLQCRLETRLLALMGSK